MVLLHIILEDMSSQQMLQESNREHRIPYLLNPLITNFNQRLVAINRAEGTLTSNPRLRLTCCPATINRRLVAIKLSPLICTPYSPPPPLVSFPAQVMYMALHHGSRGRSCSACKPGIPESCPCWRVSAGIPIS